MNTSLKKRSTNCIPSFKAIKNWSIFLENIPFCDFLKYIAVNYNQNQSRVHNLQYGAKMLQRSINMSLAPFIFKLTATAVEIHLHAKDPETVSHRRAVKGFPSLTRPQLMAPSEAPISFTCFSPARLQTYFPCSPLILPVNESLLWRRLMDFISCIPAVLVFFAHSGGAHYNAGGVHRPTYFSCTGHPLHIKRGLSGPGNNILLFPLTLQRDCRY